MFRPVVKVAPTTLEDIDQLVADMRDQDVAELRAAGHGDLHTLLVDSVAMSRWSYGMRIDTKLACVIGLAVGGTVLTPVGVPWMIGTHIVPTHHRILTRLARRIYIPRMLEEAPYLMNTVHARNFLAIRWLKHMGFHLREPHQVQPSGEMFHLFEMRA
jgi:hypothetical protein